VEKKTFLWTRHQERRKKQKPNLNKSLYILGFQLRARYAREEIKP